MSGHHRKKSIHNISNAEQQWRRDEEDYGGNSGSGYRDSSIIKYVETFEEDNRHLGPKIEEQR